MKPLIDQEAKVILENNPVALATVTPDGEANVTPVAYVKLVEGDKLLITDNYMNQCVRDIAVNPSVCLAVWDAGMNGYKMLGTASYHTQGAWAEAAKKIPENRGMPVKGAILVEVKHIFSTK